MNLHNVILPPRERGRVATLREIESAMLQGAQAIFPVVGECLEGAGVQDGGWVAVDTLNYPPPRNKGKEGAEWKDLVPSFPPFPGAPGTRFCAKVHCALGGLGRVEGTVENPVWGGRAGSL